MICAWDELLRILPVRIRKSVDRQGKQNLEELRLRIGLPPELVLKGTSQWLDGAITGEELLFCINTASRYSPWAATTIAQGFLTVAGGHRIGICGDAVIRNGKTDGIRNPRSLCIRVARDFPGLATGTEKLWGSVLIVGPPGSGKTTLLRDVIRLRSENGPGSVGVVDERGELFPEHSGFISGKRTDILSGCGKAEGVEMILRTMGPRTIAMDEITSEGDCKALIRAGWCGVNMLATAHASSRKDLQSRPVYQPLIQSGIFETLLVMQPDKSWRMERMVP